MSNNKNVWLLPTDKPSRLLKTAFGLELLSTASNGWRKPNQNIYITNSEEIKEGDWFIRDDSIHKCFRVHETDIEFLTSIDSVYCGSNTFWKKEFCKKIILTTDQDLIKDGVQAIDDEFLEWFVKNLSCEKVKVESNYRVKSGTIKEHKQGVAGYEYYDYKTIIPQEEPKQETLKFNNNERVYLKEDNNVSQVVDDNTKDWSLWERLPEQEITLDIRLKRNTRSKLTEQLIWQQERMYSEEEVLDILSKIINHIGKDEQSEIWMRLNYKQWFEQFKKQNNE